MQIILFLILVPLAGLGNTPLQGCQDPILEELLERINSSMNELEYDVAIAQSLKLGEIAEKEACYQYLFKSYNLLYISYIELRDSVPSLLYAKKALYYAEKSKDSRLMAAGYDNLAALYMNNKDTQDKALQLYEKAIKLDREYHNGDFMNAALNIAELYKKMGNYDAMPAYLEEAEASLTPQNIKFDDPRVYIDVLWGDYFFHKNDEEKAFYHYDLAFKGAQKSSLRLVAIDFYPRYADRLSAVQQYQKAYEVEKQLLHYEKEAAALESEESLLIAKAKAEGLEYKRQRNETSLQQQLADQNLQRKNTKGILTGLLFILLIIFVIYLFLSMRSRKSMIINLKKNNLALKRANETIAKSSAARAQFFSTLSHEMRTPLYGVTGIIALLEKSPSFKAHTEELSSLKFSAGHLLDIINDLLDIAKLETNTFELQLRPFNLKTLVKELVSSLDQYRVDQNTKIHLELSQELPNYVIGDSRRISQILLNILSNSIKFTKNGDVWIKIDSKKLSTNKYTVSFSIEDNGIGMDEKSQQVIFDEFKQLEEKAVKDSGGTGLGLPIVKKILEKMDSKIDVESKKDVGTLFSFNIVLAEATLLDVIEFSSAKNQKATLDKPEIMKGALILIVDDNKINRMVTSKILLEKGATTAEAASGEEAIEKVKSSTYDLILMDINMPGINGFDTTKTLREMNIKTPIIALTAADAGYMERMIKSNGMNGAIIKPYSMDEFMKVMNLHLSQNKKTVNI